MARCLVCEKDLEPFLDFGPMPIANGFLGSDQYASEHFFNLGVGFCPGCKMTQLTELMEQERMFHEHYAFFSSTSAFMARHFEQMSAMTMARLPGPDPFVVEIGCNDGIMLKHFQARGIRHLGIEPSANVAAEARRQGIEVVVRFFDEDLAREIVARHGQADAFLGANVMCHIPYQHSVLAGVRLLLKPTGLLIFEDPYLGDIIRKTSYDQIYDEHVFYFSLTSISRLVAAHGLEVVDVQPQEVHGGSMRYLVAHQGAYPVAEAVGALLAEESRLGLGNLATYHGFRQRVEASRDALRSLLAGLKAGGKRVVGYGATSKSTTVTNYCGLGPELVEFISDTTPIKQGKFSPGAHIPVRPYGEFTARYPDYALLFAWNHSAEIMAKEAAFAAGGGKWIVYVPEVKVV